jgi:mono/diheme cytochrome c family protein
MTRAIVAIFAALFAARTMAATADVPVPAPSIRFDALTHDFGAIPSSAKRTFSWPYRNEGSSPLEITATVPSCGCTASVAEPTTVPAGGAGALAVTYDPTGQSGDVRKTITVLTNDPVHPRTILTILAKVTADENAPAPGAHPRITGQSLLMGACTSCHAAPARGKTGAALWTAVCAMCHGASGEGASAPALRATADHVIPDDAALASAIAYGTANPKMPGFSELMGGPLDAAQVASLVALIRGWEPPVPAPPAAAPAPKR